MVNNMIKEVICNARTQGYVISLYCQSKCIHADYHILNNNCHNNGYKCIYTDLVCHCG